MWDFVRFSLDEAAAADHAELAARVQERTGLEARVTRRLTTIKHGVTRFRITLECYLADYVKRGASSEPPRTTRWVTREELDNLPLSSTGRKLARMTW